MGSWPASHPASMHCACSVCERNLLTAYEAQNPASLAPCLCAYQAGTLPQHRGRSVTGGKPSQLGLVAEAATRNITYGVRKPLRYDASWFAILVSMQLVAVIGWVNGRVGARMFVNVNKQVDHARSPGGVGCRMWPGSCFP